MNKKISLFALGAALIAVPVSPLPAAPKPTPTATAR